MSLSRVRVVGSGLIGTSIGLGLAKSGVSVAMIDTDPRAQSLAQDLVGDSFEGEAELVILATPISAFSKVIASEFESNPKALFIDVSSVKSKVKVEISAFPKMAGRFIPSHPMAGREVGGAESARGDLFEGRVWVIDSSDVAPESKALVLECIELLGATVVEMSSEKHDRAVALISHLPQLTASLLAGQLIHGDESELELSGAGVRDTTRIASSDPRLWREIIVANRDALEPMLISMRDDLDRLIESLGDEDAIEDFIERGKKGRARIPGKHGGRSRNYSYLPIVIEDRAGQLAALFDECAAASVNVEDLTIEHSPGQFTGLITLALSESDAEILQRHLKERGWNVHQPR